MHFDRKTLAWLRPSHSIISTVTLHRRTRINLQKLALLERWSLAWNSKLARWPDDLDSTMRVKHHWTVEALDDRQPFVWIKSKWKKQHRSNVKSTVRSIIDIFWMKRCFRCLGIFSTENISKEHERKQLYHFDPTQVKELPSCRLSRPSTTIQVDDHWSGTNSNLVPRRIWWISTQTRSIFKWNASWHHSCRRLYPKGSLRLKRSPIWLDSFDYTWMENSIRTSWGMFVTKWFRFWKSTWTWTPRWNIYRTTWSHRLKEF